MQDVQQFIVQHHVIRRCVRFSDGTDGCFDAARRRSQGPLRPLLKGEASSRTTRHPQSQQAASTNGNLSGGSRLTRQEMVLLQRVGRASSSGTYRSGMAAPHDESRYSNAQGNGGRAAPGSAVAAA